MTEQNIYDDVFPYTVDGCKSAKKYLMSVGYNIHVIERQDGWSIIQLATNVLIDNMWNDVVEEAREIRNYFNL